MSKLKFIAIEQNGCRDGTYGWQLEVNGKIVCDHLRSGDLEIGNQPITDALESIGVEVEFDYD